ncbi:M48 family metallopeptidase [filamentous cyanobacterium LEGE 11480]|uniref:M48 family metallopeptidase n=1 Tax=Romeriopsis navalis LEGE 11480 TaxID=2777977 RepID=A0A928Z5N4_9CYAN|nr:M48 family metallopeptidase [Romeriopsis navalis]MBE9031460.1 M48 family metallopeptidase [Romeriopsis navalis LEGE 11480]
MNFFEHQDQARKQTKKLLVLFGASVLTLVLGVYIAAIVSLNAAAPGLLGSRCVAITPDLVAPVALAPAGFDGASVDLLAMQPAAQSTTILSTTDVPTPLLAKRRSSSFFGRSSRRNRYYRDGYSSRRRYRRRSLACTITSWWQPHIFLGVGTVTTAIIGLSSLWKTNQLKQGGGVVAAALGGRLLNHNLASDQEQMLLNVVEEMAIASGTPVPAVYVLDHENGINAFAAGFTPNDAVIGVTRGSLDQFTRDELQGVIGHEFSHILNGDMRLNIRLMGWLHGILCIYLVGRGLAEWGRFDRDDDGNAIGFFGLALVVFGLSGLFFGRLMQSAISRQREYLADASAVQFTRNPEGIASALEKIRGGGSQVKASYAQASSHMFFGSVLSKWWTADWFATHPPIGKRIMHVRGLQPGDLAAMAESAGRSSVATAAGVAEFADGEAIAPSRPATSPRPAAALPDQVLATSPEQVITQIGTVDPSHYDYAKGLLAEIPVSLRADLRQPQSASRLIYALMLDRENPFTYQQQIDYLQQVEDPAGIEQIFALHTQLKTLNSRLYLPMLDLAIPALRQTAAQDCQRVLKVVHELAKIDGQWTLAEFVSYLVLQYRLQPHITAPQPPTVDYKDIAPVWHEALTLIAALAKIGSQNAEEVAFAFRTGLFRLPGVSQNAVPEGLPSCSLGELRRSLDKVRRVTPKLKQGIVDACSQTVMVDHKITLKQADLLRAIVILLDCPVPPFLDSERFVAEG